jgi:mRNA-degrading endonuclease HigB of HigAB toxin-antitoxin module
LVTIDHAICQALWQWARRRHPKKPQRWIKKKDCQHIEQRHGVFCGEIEGRKGRPLRVRLGSAAEVRIKRPIKISGEANPYDPAWEQDFAQRLGLKMPSALQGRRQWRPLWRAQHGLLPVCDQHLSGFTACCMSSHFEILLLHARHLSENVTPILGAVRWFKIMQQHDFTTFEALRVTFSTADKVGDFIVFNIGGNKYRLITAIHFNRRKVYIRHVLTHQEYDRGAWKT